MGFYAKIEVLGSPEIQVTHALGLESRVGRDAPQKDGDTDHLMDADEKEIEQKMIKTILNMPKEVQDRFKVLHMLSDKRSKLNDEFNDACKKLEA